MKLRFVSLAVATLAASCAVNAAQLTAQQKTDLNDAKTRTLYIAGASAVQKGFGTIVSSLFTGTPLYFSRGALDANAGTVKTGITDADFIAAMGTLAAGNGAWSGQKALVIYRVRGGSVYGVDPVAKNQAIDTIVVDGNCGDPAFNTAVDPLTNLETKPGVGTGTSAAPFSCAVGNNNIAPDAGVSDIAPKYFKEAGNTEGESPSAALTPSQLSVFGDPIHLYSMAFGIAATNAVDTTASLNRATVAAIYSGNITNWSSVAGATAGDIVICRRTPGSGTQAVLNMWANGYPCSDASQPTVDRDASGAWDAGTRKFTVANGAGGLIVIENSSSADVRSCLDAAQGGGTYKTTDRAGDPVTVDFGTTGGYKAIGVLSMDSWDKPTPTGKWGFRSMNGAGKQVNNGGTLAFTGTGTFPTVANLVTGDWDMQGWVTLNIPTRTTGAKLAVLNNIKTKAQDPATISGTTALSNAAAAIPDGLRTGQVLKVTYAGGTGEQCAPLNRQY